MINNTAIKREKGTKFPRVSLNEKSVWKPHIFVLK